MKKCSECKHAILRFNNGNGATTCNLLSGRIVVYGMHQDITPKICPYVAHPDPRDSGSNVLDPMKLTKENFHEVIKPEKFYVSYANFGVGTDWSERVKPTTNVVWRFVRIVEVEEDNIIFEVKTVEELPRKITMSTNGVGWHREVEEVEVNNDSEDL